MQPVERAFIERRSGKDRRRFYSLKRFFYGKKNRRSSVERRSTEEMRADWIRISRWSSAPLQRLKISKYILK